MFNILVPILILLLAVIALFQHFAILDLYKQSNENLDRWVRFLEGMKKIFDAFPLTQEAPTQNDKP